ncbi:MAG: hypothetical protein KatS3mg008_0187 [Acidimicrobiales bacterium]|nr:MAG: hypothetical protein KatS3mg008_0187 [Acidimicrobiales bacterium]
MRRSALEGTLGDLDLGSLLGFLRSGSVTGRLAFGAPGTGVVLFVDGCASLGIADPVARIDSLFVGSGLVEEHHWDDVVAKARRSSLAEALTERGVPEERVREIIRAHALAALALTEPATPFSFEPGVRPDFDTGVRMEPSDLLGGLDETRARLVAAMRRVGSWDHRPLLRRHLPRNLDRVTISASDWAVITAVDGCRSAREICAATGSDPVSVVSSLARMIELKMLEMSPPKVSE